MQISKTERAKAEQANIETVINIVRRMLTKWEDRLHDDLSEQDYKMVINGIEKETKKLDELKDKYPEHFL